MKVWELIEALKQVDISKEVYGFFNNDIHTLDIECLDELSDRVDINIGSNERSRYELVRCKDGFMAYDHDCDEYLEDKHGDNLFDDINEANKLIEDAVYTNIQHREAVWINMKQ